MAQLWNIQNGPTANTKSWNGVTAEGERASSIFHVFNGGAAEADSDFTATALISKTSQNGATAEAFDCPLCHRFEKLKIDLASIDLYL